MTRNKKTRKIYAVRPRFMVGRKMWLSYRVSYILYRGPIPEGECVCHGCDNPLCVNPEHLWTGSRKSNQEDMALKGRSARGESHPRAKYRWEEVQRMRALHEMGYANKDIALGFGVSANDVSRIIRGLRWKARATVS